MKPKQILLLALVLSTMLTAQQKNITPDLSTYADTTKWTILNREVTYDDAIQFDTRKGDGLLFLKDFEFTNGIIETDIKGENKPGQSFVGIAFHGINDSTYDAVYFRPFNFEKKERSNHSVQYIHMPGYGWKKLRTDFPEKYEDSLIIIPNPDNWFHAKIEVNYPKVEVYIENSETPTLIVEQISKAGKGWVGFWVGYNSKGSFKNLSIKSY